MTNIEKHRPLIMSLKKRITLFGCLLIILQLMLFDYLVGVDKDGQEFTAYGTPFQAGHLHKSWILSQ
jgi:hypothetical protein